MLICHQEVMMSALTIRGLDDATTERLKREAESRGASVNTVVKDLLRHGLGLDPAEEIADGIIACCGRLHSRFPHMKILLLAIFPDHDRGLRIGMAQVRCHSVAPIGRHR